MHNHIEIIFSSLLRKGIASLVLLFCFSFWLEAPQALGQGKPQVIQFSGLVTSGDSLYGVAGVTVYVPKAGRGTITNDYGYFSMPVLAGDSVVIRAIGYQHLTVKIPKNYNKQSYSVILELKEDVTVLPEVRIFPYPTEKDFKQAFLKLRLPERDLTAPERSLNASILAAMFATTPMGTSSTFRSSMDMQQLERDRRNGIAPNTRTNNPLLNPFAWMKFIEQIKNGDLKKK
jgi:CarboxypepD_reg-like domain